MGDSTTKFWLVAAAMIVSTPFSFAQARGTNADTANTPSAATSPARGDVRGAPTTGASGSALGRSSATGTGGASETSGPVKGGPAGGNQPAIDGAGGR